jgi:hydrogenase/urease accessory protein HupE
MRAMAGQRVHLSLRNPGLALLLTLGGLAVLGDSRVAAAHSFAPALLEIREHDDGSARVTWKTSAIQPAGARLEPILPASCRRTSASELAESGDGIVEIWTIACERSPAGESGLVGARLSVRDLDVARTDVLVRVALADGRTIQTVLRASDVELTIPARPERLQVLRSYAHLGFEHILGGPDHLLFVLGLLLIVRGKRSLIETVTAFTVGHSLTLSLAVLGIANVSSAPTEFAIALSVLALAVEVARGPDAPPTLIRTRPWLIAFAFGLLHGLGFAAALREIGLPDGEIPLALFSFNVGIELGQLVFVAAVELSWLAARSLWTRAREPHLERFSWLPTYAMGSLAAYWCFERAAALFR